MCPGSRERGGWGVEMKAVLGDGRERGGRCKIRCFGRYNSEGDEKARETKKREI